VVWERVSVDRESGLTLHGGPALNTISAWLESGGRVEDSFEVQGIGPADLVAVLLHLAVGAGDPLESPPLVQSGPPLPWLLSSLSESSWKVLLPSTPRPLRLSLLSGLLQIHDFWEESHEAAQQADDLGEKLFAPYWHGIAHRREPDPWNAGYWFRRVGGHPLFADLSTLVQTQFEPLELKTLPPQLLQGGRWDPYAFVDYCTKAQTQPTEEHLARSLQRLELITLLNQTALAAGLN